MVSTTKDPAKVRAGTLGATKRWSNPDNRRVVRLDELHPSVRAAVLALVEAAKSRPEAPEAA